MKKLTSCILLLFATVSTVWLQELPEIIPPSPNAASLGEYGQVPVGLFTGTPQINVPIYTLSGRNLAVPISLNYSSNGIRVDQVASHVGLGWSLNAGGAIVRTVLHKPDEIGRLEYPGPEDALLEGLFLSAIVTDGSGDIKPDIFSFNFNGFSGKFFLDENYTPVLIDASPVKIEKLTSLSDSTDPVPEFKITAPDGTAYYFGGVNATETSFSRPHGCGQSGPGASPTYPSETGWYLTKIESLTGDVITLSYDTENYTFDTGVSQSLSRIYYSDTSGDPGACDGLGYDPVYLPACLNKNNTSVSYLTEISASTGTVIFNYETDNSAFATEKKRLSSIEIKGNNDNPIQSFELDYTLFNSDLSFQNPDITNLDEHGKRLFLTSLTSKSSAGTPMSPYVFEYHNPEQLPPRFSYAQDYWGYFNGKSNTNFLPGDLSMYNSGLYQEGLSVEALKGIFNDLTGDRTADGSYGVKGMLKKITYPTGGSNELIYEPHSYYDEDHLVYPDQKANETLTIQTTDGQMGTFTDTKTIFSSSDQDIFINGSVIFNSYDNTCDPNIYPTHWITAMLKVKDLSNGEFVDFWDVVQFGDPVNLGGSLNFDDTLPADDIYVTLEGGKSYEFKLEIIRPCLYAYVYFDFYDQQHQVQTIEANVDVGGVRIAQVNTLDENGSSQIKQYKYGAVACPDCSSAVFDKFIPAVTYFNFQDGYGLCKKVTLSSSSLMPLYTSQGYHLTYEHVFESIGEDFSGGGIAHQYYAVLDQLPIMVEGNPIPGTPYTNNYLNGIELQTKVYKQADEGLVLQNETVNTYVMDNRISSEIWGYDATIRAIFINQVNNFNEYNFSKYKVSSYWTYLKSSQEKKYDQNGLNPVITTTDYDYDNPEHLQLSRKKVAKSNDKAVITKMYYPDDVEDSCSLGEELTLTEAQTYNKMSSVNLHQVSELVQLEQYHDDNTNGIADPDELISRQRTKYKEWHPNVVLPEYIQTSTGQQALEDRIIYQDYDAFDNPREVFRANGTAISYIWGYQQTRPIARLEGISYADIDPTTILSLQTLSDNDIDVLSEQNLRDALDILYDDYPDAVITGFTYDPLIGVTSITDPKGYTHFYHYDSFNRLESIKDRDGNLIEASHYNYGQQNQP